MPTLDDIHVNTRFFNRNVSISLGRAFELKCLTCREWVGDRAAAARLLRDTACHCLHGGRQVELRGTCDSANPECWDVRHTYANDGCFYYKPFEGEIEL